MSILRLALLILAVVLIGRIVRAFWGGGGRAAQREGGDSSKGTNMILDPVCEVYIPRSRAVLEKIRGETHYFCSEECAEKFRKGASAAQPG